MSTALSTIVSRVQTLLGDNAMITSSQVQSIVQVDHITILNDTSWSRRKLDALINTVATYSTGSVSASGGTVTGSGTTFTSGMVGRYIRMGSLPFFQRITAFGSATSLTIEADVPADVAAGTSYTIFKHIYSLPSDFGRETNVVLDIRLSKWARLEIDRLDPYRSSTATNPDVYTIYGLDPSASPQASGAFQIEFWPVPSATRAIRVEYLQTDELSASTDLPLYRSDVLVWKSAESCCFFLLARTGDQSWQALSDRFHGRYLEALQSAKEEDLGRFSTVSHVQDAALRGVRGDDWFLDHDWLRLR